MMGGAGGMGGMAAILGETSKQLGGAFQSIVGTYHSARENEKAREWAEKMMRIGPALRMRGLKEAGINPILAAGGHFANMPSAGMIGGRGGGTPGGGFGSEYTTATKGKQELQNLKVQEQILRQQQQQEWNKTAASDYMPAQAAADAELTSARAALARAGVPRARTQEKFLGDLESEVMEMYERAGGMGRLVTPSQSSRDAWRWLSEEHREGKTPYQRFRRWLKSR